MSLSQESSISSVEENVISDEEDFGDCELEEGEIEEINVDEEEFVDGLEDQVVESSHKNNLEKVPLNMSKSHFFGNEYEENDKVAEEKKKKPKTKTMRGYIDLDGADVSEDSVPPPVSIVKTDATRKNKNAQCYQDFLLKTLKRRNEHIIISDGESSQIEEQNVVSKKKKVKKSKINKPPGNKVSNVSTTHLIQKKPFGEMIQIRNRDSIVDRDERQHEPIVRFVEKRPLLATPGGFMQMGNQQMNPLNDYDERKRYIRDMDNRIPPPDADNIQLVHKDIDRRIPIYFEQGDSIIYDHTHRKNEYSHPGIERHGNVVADAPVSIRKQPHQLKIINVNNVVASNVSERRNVSIKSTDKNKSTCKFFLSGHCHRGEECKFSHDCVPEKKRELCKFYLLGYCSNRNCLYMHSEFPCKFFHTGAKCYADVNCRFSHQPLNSQDKELLKTMLETPVTTNDNVEVVDNSHVDSIFTSAVTFPSNGNERAVECAPSRSNFVQPAVGKNVMIMLPQSNCNMSGNSINRNVSTNKPVNNRENLTNHGTRGSHGPIVHSSQQVQLRSRQPHQLNNFKRPPPNFMAQTSGFGGRNAYRKILLQAQSRPIVQVTNNVKNTNHNMMTDINKAPPLILTTCVQSSVVSTISSTPAPTIIQAEQFTPSLNVTSTRNTLPSDIFIKSYDKLSPFTSINTGNSLFKKDIFGSDNLVRSNKSRKIAYGKDVVGEPIGGYVESNNDRHGDDAESSDTVGNIHVDLDSVPHMFGVENNGKENKVVNDNETCQDAVIREFTEKMEADNTESVNDKFSHVIDNYFSIKAKKRGKIQHYSSPSLNSLIFNPMESIKQLGAIHENLSKSTEKNGTNENTSKIHHYKYLNVADVNDNIENVQDEIEKYKNQDEENHASLLDNGEPDKFFDKFYKENYDVVIENKSPFSDISPQRSSTTLKKKENNKNSLDPRNNRL